MSILSLLVGIAGAWPVYAQSTEPPMAAIKAAAEKGDAQAQEKLGLRQLIEDLIVQRMTENDKIVTRYVDDKEFGSAAFAVLSKAA
jgi:hypothetical protein